MKSSSGSSRSRPERFIEDFCNLELREFQRDWLRELFRKKNGKRVYSSCLLGLPRGNGKTELNAAVSLYMLCADGAEHPQVVIAAGSDKQASEAFDAAKAMYDSSPMLQKKLEILRGRKVLRWRSDDNAWLRTVSAEGPLQHGMKPTCVLFDEVWNQKKRELWEALTGGLIKRPEPLLICISSAGYNYTDSLLGELCRRGEAQEDPRFFYRWYSAPKDCDWKDPDMWRIANPALADPQPFLQFEGLEDNARRMHEAEFRRWHLGQWTGAEESWIEASVWDACNGEPEMQLVHPDTIIGVDASIRHDSTVVATVQRHPDGVYHAEFKVWTPTPNREVPLEEVMDYIREQGKIYTLGAVVYDPQYMHHAAQRLTDEGLPMVEWRQDNVRMVPATRILPEAVPRGKLRQGGHPIARQHALAAGVKETERGLRIKKTESREQIDALVALAMAVDWASKDDKPKQSVWNTRSI